MPRTLTVSDVRSALWLAAGGAPGPAAAGHALLGRLFHRVFADLVGENDDLNLVHPLERADETLDSWRRELLVHTWQWHAGPALVRHRAELMRHTPAVATWWAALRHLVDWLAGVMWEQRARPLADVLDDVFVDAEVDGSAELRAPGWIDSVVLSGRMDAVLRQPGTGRACVLELKTGRGQPETDLAQAALYRLLARAASPHEEDPLLAVVSFAPERKELLLGPAEIAAAEAALLALVGRLADVLPDARPPVVVRTDPATESLRALGRRVVAAFAEFGLRLELDPDPIVGPTFVRFHATPDRGVRVDRMEALTRSVWTRLGTDQPPQVAIHRGRVTLDVQRPDRRPVPWADLRRLLPVPAPGGVSRFPAGLGVDGSIKWVDLAHPEDAHLLVTGTTGSGKSEWLRALIASLLFANESETLQLVLIDPKRSAFRAFEGSRFVRGGVVYPGDTDVVAVLDRLVAEMEERYRRFEGRELAQVNARGGQAPFPRILCICDEYADLVGEGGAARRAIESRVQRLGQKARAAGIHLVLATQRPSRDVVRGVILANLPARVAFKSASPIESRLVLNQAGADTLLGRGDLLFKDVGDPLRLQSPLVTESDLAALLR